MYVHKMRKPESSLSELNTNVDFLIFSFYPFAIEESNEVCKTTPFCPLLHFHGRLCPNTHKQVDDTITLSILEIYNEQIHDLLIETSSAAGVDHQRKLDVRKI